MNMQTIAVIVRSMLVLSTYTICSVRSSANENTYLYEKGL